MTQGDLNAAKTALRKILDEAGYGSWVNDEQIERAAYAVVEALDDHRKTRTAKS
jgi:hypothetical protein